MTSIHCKESLKENELQEVKKHPELYIEINMIMTNRIVDSFYIPTTLKHFTYKGKKYNIKDDTLYLLPLKSQYLMPTCVYRENDCNPVVFKQTNKGITPNYAAFK